MASATSESVPRTAAPAQDQAVSLPGSGLLFASPVISTQLVFDIDNTLLVAPITEVVSNLTNLSAVGSILDGVQLAPPTLPGGAPVTRQPQVDAAPKRRPIRASVLLF